MSTEKEVRIAAGSNWCAKPASQGKSEWLVYCIFTETRAKTCEIVISTFERVSRTGEEGDPTKVTCTDEYRGVRPGLRLAGFLARDKGEKELALEFLFKLEY